MILNKTSEIHIPFEASRERENDILSRKMSNAHPGNVKMSRLV